MAYYITNLWGTQNIDTVEACQNKLHDKIEAKLQLDDEIKSLRIRLLELHEEAVTKPKVEPQEKTDTDPLHQRVWKSITDFVVPDPEKKVREATIKKLDDVILKFKVHYDMVCKILLQTKAGKEEYLTNTLKLDVYQCMLVMLLKKEEKLYRYCIKTRDSILEKPNSYDNSLTRSVVNKLKKHLQLMKIMSQMKEFKDHTDNFITQFKDAPATVQLLGQVIAHYNNLHSDQNVRLLFHFEFENIKHLDPVQNCRLLEHDFRKAYKAERQKNKEINEKAGTDTTRQFDSGNLAAMNSLDLDALIKKKTIQ